MAEVRFARKEDVAAVEAFAKTFPAMKDFAFTWRRWGNWERFPPAIALIDGEVVAFHAAAFGTRLGYLNSYYLAVAPAHQGKGLAGAVVDLALQEGRRRGCTRIKFKCALEGPGKVFWEGCGAYPLGADEKQYVYDLDLAGAPDLTNFIEWMKHRSMHAPPKESALAAYAKKGVRLG